MIKHFDIGNWFVMPISGRHIKCLCGRSFQDYLANQARFTKKVEKVTCKNCLKKINRG